MLLRSLPNRLVQDNRIYVREDISLHMETLKRYASKATNILEIGCEAGNGSTLAFNHGIHQPDAPCEVWCSVDIANNLGDLTPQDPRWSFVLGDSTLQSTVDAVPQVDYDLIFIDTLHTYDQMKAELAIWPQVATPETKWLFHDTWMGERYNPMTDAIKEFAKESDLVYEDLSELCNGLGLVRGK